VRTKLLMGSSALFMAALGTVALFLPQETAARLGAPSNPELILLIQIAGCSYLGFAMLNWMAKNVLIGGIYSRPVAIGNFTHFATVAITLLKANFNGFHAIEDVLATALYAVFAIWFGFVVFGPSGGR
jgi:hypothetical protein